MTSRRIKCPVCRKACNVKLPKDLLYITGVGGGECSVCKNDVANVLLKCHHLTLCNKCVPRMPELPIADDNPDIIVDVDNNERAITIALYYLFFLICIWFNILNQNFYFLGVHFVLNISCTLRGFMYLILFGLRMVTVFAETARLDIFTNMYISLLAIHEILVRYNEY
jgi:hypothetical protein